MSLLENRMRGAGLEVKPPGPLARWRSQWATTGMCSEDAAGTLSQNALSDQPQFHRSVGLMRYLGAPRPDRVAKLSAGASSIQAYVGYVLRGDSCAWGVVILRGGDGVHDDGAQRIVEAGAALTQQDPKPHHVAVAATECIVRLLEATGLPAGPTTIRASEAVSKVLAGIASINFYHHIQRQYRQLNRRGQVWLGEARPHKGNAWADRALAIAQMCRDPRRRWGVPGPDYSHLPTATAPADTECPVCLNDFSDVLPRPEMTSRATGGLFDCAHAVCRACDTRIQASQNAHRCPLCRAQRLRWIPRRP